MNILYSCPLPFRQTGPSIPLSHILDALLESTHNVTVVSRDDFAEFKYDVPEVCRATVFDVRASYHLKNSPFNIDVFLGCPGASLLQMDVNNVHTAVKCTLWFSSHCDYALKELTEEYPKYGIKGVPIHPYEMWKSRKEHEASDVLIVPSEWCKQTYIDHGVQEEKLRVVNFGVDSKKYHPSKEEHDGFVALFAGGNYMRKGLIYLMKAWHELGLKDAKLKIMGCKVTCAIPNVEVLGWIPDEKVPEVYRSADIFCLPSLEEGQALAGWEALSTGLPVIVTKNVGLPIKDGEEGLIIKKRDVEGLKDALLYCYDNPDEVKRMGKNARKLAKKFTWGRFREKIVKTLEEI